MAKTPPKKKRPSSFVPRILLRGAVAGVVPACVLAVASLDACSSGSTLTAGDSGKDTSDETPQVIALAMVGFDAATDDEPQIIALAMVGFDAEADAPDGG